MRIGRPGLTNEYPSPSTLPKITASISGSAIGAIPAQVSIVADPYAATDGADVLAVLTEWDDFRWLDAAKVASGMVGRTVVDARNLLDRGEWRRAGFTHLGIGR